MSTSGMLGDASSSSSKKRNRDHDDPMDESPAKDELAYSAPMHPPVLRKKIRLHSGRQFNISRLLESLEKDQLVNLVVSMMDKHPGVREHVMAHVPRPTIQTASANLLNVERKLAGSFPYSKHGPSRDDYAFSRVRQALAEMKDMLLDYLDYFTSENEHIYTRFQFLKVAAGVIARLPVWNHPHRDADRFLLFERLAFCWENVIKDTMREVNDGGRILSAELVHQWARDIAYVNHESNGMFEGVRTLFTKGLGWTIGLTSTNFITAVHA